MLSQNFIAQAKIGLAYSWVTLVTDIDATDTILLVRNTSSKYNLCIEKITIEAASAATRVDIHCPSDVTTALAGTAVTGVSLNRAFDLTCEALAKADETALAQGAIVDRTYVYANTMKEIHYGGAIELDINKSIGIDILAETTAVMAVIWGFFIKR